MYQSILNNTNNAKSNFANTVLYKIVKSICVNVEPSASSIVEFL
jgi:hypothetical protein